MAKIITSPLVSGIRGRIGSVVFQRRGNMTIARSQAISISNPSTAFQAAARNRLGLLKSQWDQLTDEVKIIWNEHAQGLKSTLDSNKVGTFQLIKPEGEQVSGYNAFVGTNARLLDIGQSMVYLPPTRTISGPSTIGTGLAETGFGIPVKIELPADSSIAGDIVRLFIQTNWPGGHIYRAAHYVLEVGDITEGSPTVVNFSIESIRAGHTTNIGSVPTAYFNGNALNFQSDVVSVDGAKSSPSSVYSTRISAAVIPNVIDIWDDTSADYKSDLGIYQTQSIPFHPVHSKLTALDLFYVMLLNYAAENPGADLTTVSKADLELAGCPSSVADQVIEGFLPMVPPAITETLTNDW